LSTWCRPPSGRAGADFPVAPFTGGTPTPPPGTVAAAIRFTTLNDTDEARDR
jgi:hypothetical protein